MKVQVYGTVVRAAVMHGDVQRRWFLSNRQKTDAEILDRIGSEQIIGTVTRERMLQMESRESCDTEIECKIGCERQGGRG